MPKYKYLGKRGIMIRGKFYNCLDIVTVKEPLRDEELKKVEEDLNHGEEHFRTLDGYVKEIKASVEVMTVVVNRSETAVSLMSSKYAKWETIWQILAKKAMKDDPQLVTYLAKESLDLIGVSGG